MVADFIMTLNVKDINFTETNFEVANYEVVYGDQLPRLSAK